MSDLISREATIADLRTADIPDEWMVWMENFINAQPSVKPERKPGKWIRTIDPDVNAWTGGHRCSECGRDCVQMSMNYCANCGAPMDIDNGKCRGLYLAECIISHYVDEGGEYDRN